MDAMIAGGFPGRNSSRAERPSFMFSSPHRTLRAFDVGERISVPAEGAHLANSPLQEAVRLALARARQAGQDNPVVVGAIPFNFRQPSCLFVPAEYQVMDRDSLGLGLGSKSSHRAVKIRSLPDRDGFTQAVAEAIACFRAGSLKKAVLSRILEIELTRRVDPIAVLDAVVTQNPSGFHFLVPLRQGGALLGASPELLVRKQGRAITSNPLAGSAKRSPDRDKDFEAGQILLRSSKDHCEHKLVTDGMGALLTPLCGSLLVPEGPELMTTPTMWHLSTTITGELAAPNVSALQLACLLHPTPAVCGAPTAEAKALIERLEPFDRGLFSGIVGWCDSAGDGEWAITIRCGTVEDKRIRLFAGAGIVEHSNPEAEWLETEAKLGTMLRAFGLMEP